MNRFNRLVILFTLAKAVQVGLIFGTMVLHGQTLIDLKTQSKNPLVTPAINSGSIVNIMQSICSLNLGSNPDGTFLVTCGSTGNSTVLQVFNSAGKLLQNPSDYSVAPSGTAVKITLIVPSTSITVLATGN
jgi:hypothetical protein